jgi:hypothetical protein
MNSQAGNNSNNTHKQAGREGGTASNTGIKEAQEGDKTRGRNWNWAVNDWKAIPDSFYHTRQAQTRTHTLPPLPLPLSLSPLLSMVCSAVEQRQQLKANSCRIFLELAQQPPSEARGRPQQSWPPAGEERTDTRGKSRRRWVGGGGGKRNSVRAKGKKASTWHQSRPELYLSAARFQGRTGEGKRERARIPKTPKAEHSLPLSRKYVRNQKKRKHFSFSFSLTSIV